MLLGHSLPSLYHPAWDFTLAHWQRVQDQEKKLHHGDSSSWTTRLLSHRTPEVHNISVSMSLSDGMGHFTSMDCITIKTSNCACRIVWTFPIRVSTSIGWLLLSCGQGLESWWLVILFHTQHNMPIWRRYVARVGAPINNNNGHRAVLRWPWPSSN